MNVKTNGNHNMKNKNANCPVCKSKLRSMFYHLCFKQSVGLECTNCLSIFQRSKKVVIVQMICNIVFFVCFVSFLNGPVFQSVMNIVWLFGSLISMIFSIYIQLSTKYVIIYEGR
jgi:hypothetical protein